MATDFRSLLSTKPESVEKPQPLPPGTYFATIKSWEPTESGQKKTPGVKVTLQLSSPDADVDMDQLEQVGGLAAVTKRKVSTTYWLTEDSTFRLRDFLETACGLDITGRSFAELLPECVNVAVRVAVKHRVTDKQEIMLDVDQILSAG
jgi:ribosomal protein L5